MRTGEHEGIVAKETLQVLCRWAARYLKDVAHALLCNGCQDMDNAYCHDEIYYACCY